MTAGDALIVLNELAQRRYSDAATNRLDDPKEVSLWPGVYFDMNGDQDVTALDALQVINELRVISNDGQREGEAVVAELLPIASVAERAAALDRVESDRRLRGGGAGHDRTAASFPT